MYKNIGIMKMSINLLIFIYFRPGDLCTSKIIIIGTHFFENMIKNKSVDKSVTDSMLKLGHFCFTFIHSPLILYYNEQISHVEKEQHFCYLEE